MLRTEILRGNLMVDGRSVNDNNIVYQVSHLTHDAAYAHALVQAMKELEAHHRGWHQVLRARAAEIMRGFGYE